MYVKVNQYNTCVNTDNESVDLSKPCLVLLHGSGMDHHFWSQQIDDIASQGMSVIAPDLPGHGKSEGPPLESVEAMGRWVWDFIDALGLKQCSLVGHSLGGLIALEAAFLSPRRTVALSLISTAMSMPVNSYLLDAAREVPEIASALLLKWAFSEEHRSHMSHSPIIISSFLNSLETNPLFVDLSVCHEYQGNEERLKQINTPCQLIMATQDLMVPLTMSKMLLDVLPNIQSVVELECGHMIPLESADACMLALFSFHQRLAAYDLTA